MDKEKKKKAIKSQLVTRTQTRENPDIARYREALRQAESVTNPNRVKLHKIYREVLLDAKVAASIQRIIAALTNAKVRVRGESRDIHEINRFIKSPHFLKLIQYIAESKFWGFSLIEFDFAEGDKTINDVILVPRDHVIPELGVVVRTLGTTDYISYDEYKETVLPVGGETDLGLLNVAVPLTIFKRANLSNWAEYVERFAVPLRLFTYDPTVPNAKTEVEKNANFGGSATIVMPQGTALTFPTAAPGGGSVQTFDDYRNALNEELALLFLTNTMTTQDGSSRSQAEIHAEGELKLLNSYRVMVELALNTGVKQILAANGWDVAELEFAYDDTEKLSKMELADLLIKIQQVGFQPPAEFLNEQFGIQFMPTAATHTPVSQGANLNLKYCGCRTGLGLHKNALMLKLEDGIDDTIKRAWARAGQFDHEYFDSVAQELLKGFNTEYTFETNQGALAEFNMYKFSAARTAEVQAQLSEISANTDTFHAFEQRAREVLQTYNTQYLETEYNYARSVAASMRQHDEYMAQAEAFPFWRYQTIGDENVRDSHARLDGLIFKAGQMGRLMPPLGWGCRCEVIPITEEEATTDVTTEGDALNLFNATELSALRKEGLTDFSDGEIFRAQFTEGTWQDYGLKKYAIAAANAKDIPASVTREEALTWYKAKGGNDEKSALLLDWRGRKVELTKNKLLSADFKFGAVHATEEALREADEVWAEQNGKTWNLKFVKYYKKNPLVITVLYNKKNISITEAKFATNPDALRKGICIWKK